MRTLLTCLLWSAASAAAAQSPSDAVADLRSPDGRNVIKIVKAGVQAQGMAAFMAGGGGALRYSVSRDDKPVIAPSALGLSLGGPPGMGPGGPPGLGLQVSKVETRSVDQTHVLTATKASSARDHFNEVTVSLGEPGGQTKLQVVFRAYDDGVALRYRVPPQPGQQQVEIRSESTEFRFADAERCWGLNLGRTGSSHEGEYDPIDAGLIRSHNMFDAPLTCRTGAGGTFMIAEADLRSYGGMYLAGIGEGSKGVAVQPSPLPGAGAGPFAGVIARRQMTPAGIDTPWRVVLLGDRAGDLIESNLIGNLNPPSKIKDTSWIKPGKAAWDWWSGPYPMTMDPGAANMDMATLERFIDFADESGFEYMLIDAGWSYGSGPGGMGGADADLTRTIPGLDMPKLVARAKARNVGLMVWVDWSQLDKQLEPALAQYAKWGLKGIKADYMNRDDQGIVEFYERVMSKAAEHKLLVDMHGAYHPTGLNRTWPNFMTQEGVLGSEYNKWSARATARHDVTLPYTRMVIGPMDYTPGGFRNVKPEDFQARMTDPVVMSTRAHGLAMYVVFESPLQMVSDKPEAYAGADGFDFIKQVPTSWDETRFVAGEIGDYVVLARRKGKDWYLGAMTNEEGRTVTVPLNFLGQGAYTATIWRDGASPTDAPREVQKALRSGGSLQLNLAPTGGAAIHFTPGG